MKKLFLGVGLAGLLAAAAWLFSITNVTIAASPTAVESPAVFGRFPLNRAVVVNFDAADDAFSAQGARGQTDQALDWLLLAVLNDAGLTPAGLNQATYDMPVIRRGYLQPVATQEYGRTRSRALGDGRVIALVPAPATPAERAHLVAGVFDEQRKNLGKTPREIVVFGYTLDLSKQRARLTREAPVPAKDLLTSAYGYHETVVASLHDLTQFLRQTNDVVHAAQRDGKLVLGGRQLTPSQYIGIGVEEVASLWQSEQQLAVRSAAHQKKWDGQLKELNTRWRNAGRLDQAGYDRAVAELMQRAQQDGRASGIAEHSGFSLDWALNYPSFIAALVQLQQDLATPAAFAPSAAFVRRELDKVIADLRQEDTGSFYALLRNLLEQPAGGAELSHYLEGLSQKHSFQHARYDGDLAGTAVGMNMFYTDLLAKLWAIDFEGATGTGVVADFKPMVKTTVSVAFERELREQSDTRLWFGQQDRGIQLGRGKQEILFARNAARVYAASSNSLMPGKETVANAQSAQFLGWWDDHYEEIAAFEPQYERLNQIVKWSAILGWLNADNNGGLLAFLNDVPVTRSHWFPDWARRQPGLRYARWNSIEFFPMPNRKARIEALPLLKSAAFQEFGRGVHRLTGGVSLPSREMFSSRASLATEMPDIAKRSWIDYTSTLATDGNGQLKFLSGVGHTLSSSRNHAELLSTAQAGVKLRTASGELAPGTVKRLLQHDGGTLAMDVELAGKPAGKLTIAGRNNTIEIAWRSRELDQVHAIATRASRARQVNASLLHDPEVEAVLQLEGRHHYAVRLGNSHQWYEIAPETRPSANLANGWDGRVADGEQAAHTLQFRAVDAASLNQSADAILVLKHGYRPQAGKLTLAQLDSAAPRPAGIIDSLQSRETARTARHIADDPAASAAALKAHLADKLKAADRLMAEGNTQQAIRTLEQLQAVHGHAPDIQMRLALARIGQGKAQRAAADVNAMESVPIRERAMFLEEVNRRISLAQGSERTELLRYREFVALHGMLHGKHGKHAVLEPSDYVQFGLHDNAPLRAHASKVEPPHANADDVLLYVQSDLPGMDNINWNQPLSSVLQQLPQGRRVLLQLDDVSVAEFLPDRIYAADVSVNLYRKPRNNPSQQVVRPAANSAGSARCDTQAPADRPNGSRCPDQQRQPVYVLLAQG